MKLYCHKLIVVVKLADKYLKEASMAMMESLFSLSCEFILCSSDSISSYIAYCEKQYQLERTELETQTSLLRATKFILRNNRSFMFELSLSFIVCSRVVSQNP